MRLGKLAQASRTPTTATVGDYLQLRSRGKKHSTPLQQRRHLGVPVAPPLPARRGVAVHTPLIRWVAAAVQRGSDAGGCSGDGGSAQLRFVGVINAALMLVFVVLLVIGRANAPSDLAPVGALQASSKKLLEARSKPESAPRLVLRGSDMRDSDTFPQRCDAQALREYAENASALFSQHDLMYARMLRSVSTFETPLLQHVLNATFGFAPSALELARNNSWRATYTSALASLLFSGNPLGAQLASDLYDQELWAPEAIEMPADWRSCGQSRAAGRSSSSSSSSSSLGGGDGSATPASGVGPACAIDLAHTRSYLPPHLLLLRWRSHPAVRCAQQIFALGARGASAVSRARFNSRVLLCSARDDAGLALLQRVECVTSANARCRAHGAVSTVLRGHSRRAALWRGSSTEREAALAWASAARALTGGPRMWSDAWLTGAIGQDVATMSACALRHVGKPAVEIVCTGTAHPHRLTNRRGVGGMLMATTTPLTIGMHVDSSCATRACAVLDPYLRQARIMATLYGASTIVLSTHSFDVIDRVLLENAPTAAFQWCWADVDRESIADHASRRAHEQRRGTSTFASLADLHLFAERADVCVLSSTLPLHPATTLFCVAHTDPLTPSSPYTQLHWHCGKFAVAGVLRGSARCPRRRCSCAGSVDGPALHIH